MQVIQIRALGRRSSYTAISGRVSQLSRREALQRRLLGASGPLVAVCDFHLRDSASDELREVRGVPALVGVRAGQSVTLVYRRLGRSREWLLGARNNSTGKVVMLPPRRPTLFWAMVWMLVTWGTFWVAQYELATTRAAALPLLLLLFWVLVGAWLLFRARVVGSQLETALEGGERALAELAPG